MRTVTVKVTQEDIDTGEPEDNCRCPVAIALRRSLGVECRVDGDEIKIRRGEGFVCLNSPPAVEEFVTEFDSAYLDLSPDERMETYWREGFAPFSFPLELPDEPT